MLVYRQRTRAEPLLDLASVLELPVLEAALDSAVRGRLVSLRRLEWRLNQVNGRGKTGIGTLRGLLLERFQGAPSLYSLFEARFLSILKKGGLPGPSRQVPMYDDEGLIRHLDFAYPEARLNIETDRFKDHSSKAAFKRDRRNDIRLQRLGWKVLRFTWDDLEDADFIITSIRSILFPRLLGAVLVC